VWVVTEEAWRVEGKESRLAPLLAPLWGLLRTFSVEHPKQFGGLIDLEFGASNNILELFPELPVGEFALRKGTLYAQTEEEIRPAKTKIVINSSSSYLITGGTGALGKVVVDWLVTRGAKRIVVLSRRAPTTENRHHWRELESRGVSVFHYAGSVSDVNVLSKVIVSEREAGAPVEGLFHLAGISIDEIISNVSARSVRDGIDAKVLGGDAITRLAEENALNFCVFLASDALLHGNVGQGIYAAANSFLWALAGPGGNGASKFISIALGPFDGPGMASSERLRAHFGRRGVDLLSVADVEAALNTALASDCPRILAVRYKPPKATQKDFVPYVPLNEGRKAAASQQSRNMLGFNEKSRRAGIERILQQELGELLRYEAGASPDKEAGFFALGLDSLLAVAFVDRVHKRLNIQLPVTSVITSPSIKSLAEVLNQELKRSDIFVGVNSGVIESGR
jgi:NAD(P)-dependent dehydrogenase (short-subunit alcohol dehydrogenase family)/acyl carrier protein